jgi:hypothetical protein
MQMNRVRIGLLIAATAIAGVPAIATAQDNQRHGDRGENRGGNRGDRGAPPQNQERPQAAPQPQAPRAPEQPRAVEAPRAAGAQGYGYARGRGGDFAGRRDTAPPQAQVPQRQQVQQASPRAPGGEGRFAGDPNQHREDRRDSRGDMRGDYGRNDAARRDADRRDDRRPEGYNGYRGNDGRNGNVQVWRGGQQARDYGRAGYNRPAWRNEWRGDRRYDWQRYRDQNRRLFHAPRYVPPRNYGWGYRSFSIGYRLAPFFFAPAYWVDDPWEYRLPPVYGPYRWVRYYNDVLLVDTETGEVVDAIRDFFL